MAHSSGRRPRRRHPGDRGQRLVVDVAAEARGGEQEPLGRRGNLDPRLLRAGVEVEDDQPVAGRRAAAARRAAADAPSTRPERAATRRTSGRRRSFGVAPVPHHQLARVRIDDQVAGVGEAVAAPQRLQLVAVQAPGANDRVARVVGDHDPAARDPMPGGFDSVPYGSPLISTERTAPSSRRAHHSRTGLGLHPAAEHRVVGAVAPVVHPEDVLVGDHRIPAVAAVRPPGRSAARQRSSIAIRPAAAVEAEAEDGGGADRDHALAVGGEPGDDGLGQPQRLGHRQQRLGIEHRHRRGLAPRRRVAVLGHELAAVEDDERVVRPRHRQPVRGEHLELGAQPMRPAAEDHVQVAAGVGGDPARPVGAAGQPRRRGGRRSSVGRVEALHPGLDRRRLRPAQGHVVAQRVELAGLAPNERVGGEGLADGRHLEPLAGGGSPARLAAARSPSAAGRRPRRSTAAASTRRPPGSGSLEDRLRGLPSQRISAARSSPAARSARAARRSGSVTRAMNAAARVPDGDHLVVDVALVADHRSLRLRVP